MALKDLIAEKGALDEAAIERIVSPFVRYDVEAKEITFVQGFASLPIKAKTLVYLVALQGWKFVTDDPVPSDARPTDIEAATGVPGGSLRPTLRQLVESHVISDRDGRYSIRGTSLPAIEAELNGGERNDGGRHARSSSRRSSRRTAAADGSEDGWQSDNGGADEKRARKIRGKTGNIAATFERWINEGYFDEPRTMADVQKRFRKEAIMVQQTSLPAYFLSAVRAGRLDRNEMSVGGKTVWTYTTKKAA